MHYLRLLFGALCPDQDEVEARSILAFSLVIGHTTDRVPGAGTLSATVCALTTPACGSAKRDGSVP
jgi:hypothetical protein